MEVAVESIWQHVHSQLLAEGWKVGWAEYEDGAAESTWLVQANRGETDELADGTSLDDAFDKLHCLTR